MDKLLTVGLTAILLVVLAVPVMAQVGGAGDAQAGSTNAALDSLHEVIDRLTEDDPGHPGIRGLKLAVDSVAQ